MKRVKRRKNKLSVDERSRKLIRPEAGEGQLTMMDRRVSQIRRLKMYMPMTEVARQGGGGVALCYQSVLIFFSFFFF